MESKEVEYVKKYNKDYYNKHKIERSQQGKTKIQCTDCNSAIRKENLRKHTSTNKHKNKVISNQNINNALQLIHIKQINI